MEWLVGFLVCYLVYTAVTSYVAVKRHGPAPKGQPQGNTGLPESKNAP